MMLVIADAFRELVREWLTTLSLTVFIEILVAWPILGLCTTEGRRGRIERLAAIVGINLLTHPFAFLAVLLIGPSSKNLLSLLDVAMVVVAIEALAFNALLKSLIVDDRPVLTADNYFLVHQHEAHTRSIAIMASLCANGASMLACSIFWS